MPLHNTFFIAPIYLEMMLPSNNNQSARAAACFRHAPAWYSENPFMALKGRVETEHLLFVTATKMEISLVDSQTSIFFS